MCFLETLSRLSSYFNDFPLILSLLAGLSGQWLHDSCQWRNRVHRLCVSREWMDHMIRPHRTGPIIPVVPVFVSAHLSSPARNSFMHTLRGIVVVHTRVTLVQPSATIGHKHHSVIIQVRSFRVDGSNTKRWWRSVSINTRTFP